MKFITIYKMKCSLHIDLKQMLNETLSPITYEIVSTLHFFLTILKNAANQKKENITNDMKALHKYVCFLK
jgi:hypothetical protein